MNQYEQGKQAAKRDLFIYGRAFDLYMDGYDEDNSSAWLKGYNDHVRDTRNRRNEGGHGHDAR